MISTFNELLTVYTLIYCVLIFGKKISSNQGKEALFYGNFMLISIIYVTKILRDFSGFAPTLHLGNQTQGSPATKLAANLSPIFHSH